MADSVSKRRMGSAASFVWFLGFVGAAIYYIQHASGFWMVILAILKAFVWPALLVYQLLDFLKM